MDDEWVGLYELLDPDGLRYLLSEIKTINEGKFVQKAGDTMFGDLVITNNKGLIIDPTGHAPYGLVVVNGKLCVKHKVEVNNNAGE